jgi:hypothetical protein
MDSWVNEELERVPLRWDIVVLAMVVLAVLLWLLLLLF